jgi:molybdopterin molybdotransferase
MLELEDALERVLALIPGPVSETVSLNEAHGRIATSQVASPIDLPVFDNSAMDGYAVRAADVASASPAAPVLLRLGGRVAAGQSFTGEMAAGACIRVFTGSPLPHGADAVVMQEDTRVAPEKSEDILVLDAAKSWENVRFRGEDIKKGSVLTKEGDQLTARRISLLAASGVAQLKVARQPIIGLLATGSELREPGEPLSPGQIYESNRVGLSALLSSAGAIPIIFPIVRDTAHDVRDAVEQAFQQCDAVVTSGGVSVGEMDFVKSAFEAVGGELQFWRVAVKPGRPFVFGGYGEKFLFGLPGNPVSALVTFLLLVRPALLRWQGAADISLAAHSGVLAEPLANAGPRRHFMRVKVDSEGKVFSAGLQVSHVLYSLAHANGLVDVPPETTLKPGTVVRVLNWGD